MSKRIWHIEIVANGLGGQSMYLLWLACQKKIRARISITADTGSENDRMCSDGTRTTAKRYFDEVVAPLATAHKIDACFVRVLDKTGKPLPPIHEYMAAQKGQAKFGSQPVPLFGSSGGRFTQTCTDKWKLAAIRQECRRRNAKTMRSAIGIHYGEAARRVKGPFLYTEHGFDIYQSGYKSGKTGEWIPEKWMTHYYPLVQMQMTREDCRKELVRLGIPYLITTECDHCPHQDKARWLMHTDESLAASAALEAKYNGEFFLTDKRIPLPQVIEQWRQEPPSQETDLAFACGNDLCGI